MATILTFSTTPDILNILSDFCKETGIKRSYLINQSILAFIDINKKSYNIDKLRAATKNIKKNDKLKNLRNATKKIIKSVE